MGKFAFYKLEWTNCRKMSFNGAFFFGGSFSLCTFYPILNLQVKDRKRLVISKALNHYSWQITCFWDPCRWKYITCPSYEKLALVITACLELFQNVYVTSFLNLKVYIYTETIWTANCQKTDSNVPHLNLCT